MPAFYALNVRLWLKQVDAHFQIHRITTDVTKFSLLHVQFRPEILTQVADVIDFSDSEQKRLKTLLSGIELGDRKPSVLYNEMRQISGQMLPDDVLKNVWMNKLPENVRGHEVANIGKKSVSELVEIADLVMDVSASSSIAAAQHQRTSDLSPNLHEVKKLQETVDRLTEAVARLTRETRARSSSRSRDTHRRSTPARNRNSSKSSTRERNNDSEFCWYHDTYGSHAKNCREPCTFSAKNSKN